jgi:hypothetical protein
MGNLSFPETTKWVVAYDTDAGIYYGIEVTPLNDCASGLPSFEVFDSLSAAKEAFPQAWPEPPIEPEPPTPEV